MGAPHPGPAVAAMPTLPSYREAADRAPIPGNLKLYTRFHEKKKLRKEYIRDIRFDIFNDLFYAARYVMQN